MATGGVKLVFDENFSHLQVKFVNRESGLGQIVHTRQMTWSGKPDKEWIPFAVGAGFVIVTGDRNDKTRGYTVKDLKAIGARVIFAGGFWDHMDRWEKAKWLVKSIEKIVEVAAGLTGGEARLLVDKYCRVRSL